MEIAIALAVALTAQLVQLWITTNKSTQCTSCRKSIGVEEDERWPVRN